jgi:NADH dehydrogenase FAD-containing subunit
MTKTVVILGAGLAGLPVAHYLLKFTAANVSDLRVVLVSPNDEFYWNLASVRAVLPGKLAEDKYTWPIPEAFAKYPSDKFEFVAGKAETLNPDTNSVVVALNDGTQRNLEYHTVIVCTGSDPLDGMPWKTVGTSQKTKAAIAQLQEQIKNAKSIVVGGAGATGVEFAGELGAEYAKPGTKSVTIVSSDPLPLEARIMQSTRETTKKELEKLKVKFVADTKITAVADADGQKVLELTNKDGSKTTLKADLFVPTYGMSFNTQFAPAAMLDANKKLNQDKYLRSPQYKNVFVLGDVGNLQPPQAAAAGTQVGHIITQLEPYLKTGKVEEYKFEDKIMFGVSIGPNRGTGQMGTMKPLSLLIWWFKGRYLGTNYAKDFATGLKGPLGKAW